MLSASQQAALDAVRRWLGSSVCRERPFRLFGFAGTGKTTIAKQTLELAEPVLFGAFTGKAALVLREKGCFGATTIHKLIYRPKSKSRLKLLELQEKRRRATSQHDQLVLDADIREEEQNIKRPSFSLNTDSEVRTAGLVVIDEVSMVGRRMGEDLMSFGAPVLVLGDPAQLPPVMDGGYFTEVKPDVLLTEVHRQAAGSPVLQLATAVREGRRLEVGDLGGGTRVIRKGVLSLSDVAAFDQVLVGRNKTRKSINRRIRMEHLGRTSHLPEPGDKLVCLRNDSREGLLNGEQWTTLACDVVSEDRIWLTAQNEDRTIEAPVHRHTFEDREIPHYEVREAQSFDFAYAMTVHKAQGSAWPNVLVVDESAAFGANSMNHLYTAVTRASESVTVVIP